MGSLHVLLSPDIVHLLTEMTTGLIEDLGKISLCLIMPSFAYSYELNYSFNSYLKTVFVELG